jgi:hypothetical protein
MASLSQAPPLGSLLLPHGAFQEHAAHPPRWPGELSSKGLLDTCISSSISAFLHCAFTAHSHVILQGPPGTDPDRETLERAAAIAAYHSKARNAGVVAVSGTRVWDVSKPHGAKAGTVHIRNEKVFKVRPARGDLAGEPGHAST